MTKGRRTKQQLGAEALTELKEGRVTPGRPEWSERRPLRFWQPFNDWWRSELDRLGRRPNAQEINCWYEVYAYGLWKVDAPSLQETRVHAKCLRSLPLVRDYFRKYVSCSLRDSCCRYWNCAKPRTRQRLTRLILPAPYVPHLAFTSGQLSCKKAFWRRASGLQSAAPLQPYRTKRLPAGTPHLPLSCERLVPFDSCLDQR